jgi:hypothetical protein
MAEYRITYWREIPSMVTARDGAATSKAALPGRFQEAIDEAAMRLGETGSDAYLAGWTRGKWNSLDGDPVEVADLVVTQLEENWPALRLEEYLDSLGPASTEAQPT